jgi:hypothetical protein
MGQQTFTSNDTFTWPVGVTQVLVQCWGAGGGGEDNAGRGGGGGGFASSVVTKSGATDSVVVGTGGVDSDGGDSYFRDTGTVLAKGGLYGGNGGTGGTGSTGTITYAGGDGAAGDIQEICDEYDNEDPPNCISSHNEGTGGGGGGGAGDEAVGSNASGITGGAGGTDNGGSGGDGGANASSGYNGLSYGGGGGGAGYGDTTSGNGADGYVIVSWDDPYLDFTVQPTNTTVNETITPAVQVTLKNFVSNAIVTDFTSNITVAIGTNPSAGNLTGTLTVAATAGVSTFSDLEIDAVGIGYTLSATATNCQSDISSSFNITAAVGQQRVLNRFIFQPWIKKLCR